MTVPSTNFHFTDLLMLLASKQYSISKEGDRVLCTGKQVGEAVHRILMEKQWIHVESFSDQSERWVSSLRDWEITVRPEPNLVYLKAFACRTEAAAVPLTMGSSSSLSVRPTKRKEESGSDSDSDAVHSSSEKKMSDARRKSHELLNATIHFVLLGFQEVQRAFKRLGDGFQVHVSHAPLCYHFTCTWGDKSEQAGRILEGALGDLKNALSSMGFTFVETRKDSDLISFTVQGPLFKKKPR